ncbi:MAG TPA: MarC family protein [Holophagaceae bacterium]|jgi:multiple antibiotic resistance protein|nr:MarC family protein [Holophagaceae bacterium]
MFDSLLAQAVLFWAVIDPVGTLPIFLREARGMEPAAGRRLATQAVGFAALVLIFFVVAGQMLLEAMGVTLEAFQIAGGILLFLFSLSMVFGESKPSHELKLAKMAGPGRAIYPLAMPSIASPGALLAAVLLTDNHRHAWGSQAITTLVMLSVLLSTWLLLLAARPLQKLLGIAGTEIISRIMGLLLASLAAQQVLVGIARFYHLKLMLP